eukprot:TRINITY_DN19979_c0_g1_i1.p1 TRINITY_DN19979_c0_g1~~TRINITY_DN19979_c0_g1_i1.p1  ORF type:complete len:154 (+),score=59.82 TRINITY_DN19979_c0_g1_i1:131-592(+)
MAETFTEAQRAEYRTAFDSIDTNGDGKIDAGELAEIMRSVGRNPTEEQVKKLIKEVDANGNGTIDFEEFLSLMAKKPFELDLKPELKELFSALRSRDKANKGVISSDEFKFVMKELDTKVAEDDLDSWYKEAEKGDGNIDYEEFVTLMMNKGQ